MFGITQLVGQPRYAPLANVFSTHDRLPQIRIRSHSLSGGYIPHCYKHIVFDVLDDETEAGDYEYDDHDDDYDAEWSEQVAGEGVSVETGEMIPVPHQVFESDVFGHVNHAEEYAPQLIVCVDTDSGELTSFHVSPA